MPFREATYADLYAASRILGRAFKNDSFQGKYLHPHLDKYPDALDVSYLRKLRAYWARMDDEHKFFVSCQPSADGAGEECLTGVAIWSRRRSKPLPLAWETYLWTRLIGNYNWLEATYILPDRAQDPHRMTILDRSRPYTKHHWTGSRADVWYLDLIGVDPAFERQGIGRELVAWGFERAKKDGVGTSCIAADGRDNFYIACGFDVRCGIAGDEGPDMELRAELRSIGGGTLHFWDGGKAPEGVKKYGEE